jgi:hypothetical protein
MNKFDLIEQYVEGKLTEEEKRSFLKQLETDQELQRLYRFRTGLAGNWNKDEEYDKTKEWVGSVIQQAKNQKRALRGRIILIAASILILASLGSIWLFSRIGGPEGAWDDNQVAGASDTIVEGDELQLIPTPSYAEISEAPKVYANEGGIRLIYPTDHDTIPAPGVELILIWSPSLSETGSLALLNQDRTVLYKTQINVSDSIHKPNGLILEEGIYYWYINDTTALPFFNVDDKD